MWDAGGTSGSKDAVLGSLIEAAFSLACIKSMSF